MTSPEHGSPALQTIDRDNVLAIDNVEILRQSQLDEVNRVENARLADPDLPTADFAALTASFVENDLAIRTDDPRRADVEDLLRSHSIDRIPVDEWTTGPYQIGPLVDGADRAVEPSGRERFLTAASEYAGTTNGDDQEFMDRVAELETALEHLGNLRDSLSTLAASESGKPISTRSSEYQSALAAYNKQVIVAGKLREALAESENATRTDDEKNAETIGYLLEEQNNLREQTTEKFEATKTNKFIKWFNKGGKVRRIAKGMLIGVPAGLLSAIAAPIAGGVALGAAVGSGFMATRFTRGYARNDNARGESIAEQANEAALAAAVQAGDVNDRLETAVSHLSSEFNADKETEQKKRRKALAWGLGTVATGAAIGWFANKLPHIVPGRVTESAKGFIDNAKENIKDLADVLGDVRSNSRNVIPTPTESPSPSGAPSSEANVSLAQEPTRPENVITSPTEPSEAAPDSPEWSDAAVTVVPGEGWYQTFEDMNIPKDEWANMLEAVGPELEEQGWAYRMPNGEWGISHSGKLPSSVLQLIHDSIEG